MDNSANSIKKLYYSIGEVSKVTELKQYVLRYWETEFSQLKPPKNRAGNRTYRQKDIDLLLNIKDLLYNKKYTIDGARSVLKGDQIKGGVIKSKSITEKQRLIVKKIRDDLENILSIISE